MLTANEIIVAKAICAPGVASLITPDLARALGIRSDQASTMLSKMREKGLLYTRTAESPIACLVTWHATDYFKSLATHQVLKKPTVPNTYKLYAAGLGSHTKLELPYNDVISAAKTLANSYSVVQVYRLVATVKYTPPAPVQGTYEVT